MSASRRCVELVLYLPQESSGSPTDKAGQALGAPVEAAVDRDPAEVAPLGSGPGVTGLFDGIIVKRGNLVLAHALGRKPGGDVLVTKPFDIGENLVGPGAGNRAARLKRIAPQQDAGLTQADVQPIGQYHQAGGS